MLLAIARPTKFCAGSEDPLFCRRSPTMAAVVLGPWSVGHCLRLAEAPSPIVPVTLNVHVGTEFDSSYGRAVAVGADIAAPPVEQPWGMREFVLRLADGQQRVLAGPA
jgi:hypothetical protein